MFSSDAVVCCAGVLHFDLYQPLCRKLEALMETLHANKQTKVAAPPLRSTDVDV